MNKTNTIDAFTHEEVSATKNSNVVDIRDAFQQLRNRQNPYLNDAGKAAQADMRNRLPEQYAIDAGNALKSASDNFSNHNVLTLAAALAYADVGLTVIDGHALDAVGRPTAQNGQIKVPRGTAWQKRASDDPETIRAFWAGDGDYPANKAGEIYPYARTSAYRNVNITFPDGCGLFVLDIDGEHGLDALEALKKEHGELPRTWESVTGSGGVHLIFKATDLDIRNTASAIAPGVDIRGKNGQIVAAPSIHPSGIFYRWEDGCAPWECQVADAPGWLLTLAYEATKGRAGSDCESEKAAGKRTARGSKDRVSGLGFDGHVATIGDGNDLRGFDAPIYGAALSYFGAGKDDEDALIETLRDAILAAPCKDDRNARRYATDEYLVNRVEQAQEYIAQDNYESDDVTADADNIRLFSDPLFDERLADNGMIAGKGEKQEKNARKVKTQMRQSMSEMFSFVIVEGGEARTALHPSRGEDVVMWRDTALTKAFKNRGVFWTPDQKPVRIDPAQEFMMDPQRKTYLGTQFEPDPTRARADRYNLWTGIKAEPMAGDWSLLRGHIRDQIIDGNGADKAEDEMLFAWFMTWLADIFQNPGRKAGSAVAFIGEQGTGKSKLFDHIRDAIGAASTKITSRKGLVGNFNAQLDAKILVVAEEAFWSGDKEAAGTLKDHISSETIDIERKGVDAATRSNYIRFGFISNEEWVIPTDDNADARRFFVSRVNNNRKQDSDYFAAIDKQMADGGLEAMTHELMHWDPTQHGLTWGSLRTPPKTAALQEQASYGLSGPKGALMSIIEAGELAGIAKDGTPFTYDLSDIEPTPVLREHLVAAIQGRGTHGGAAKASGKAIRDLLGKDADKGEKKKNVEFCNPRLVTDNKEDGLVVKKGRWIEFPALVGLRSKLAETYA